MAAGRPLVEATGGVNRLVSPGLKLESLNISSYVREDSIHSFILPLTKHVLSFYYAKHRLIKLSLFLE